LLIDGRERDGGSDPRRGVNSIERAATGSRNTSNPPTLPVLKLYPIYPFPLLLLTLKLLLALWATLTLKLLL
jgi:hypothetical protein